MRDRCGEAVFQLCTRILPSALISGSDFSRPFTAMTLPLLLLFMLLLVVLLMVPSCSGMLPRFSAVSGLGSSNAEEEEVGPAVVALTRLTTFFALASTPVSECLGCCCICICCCCCTPLLIWAVLLLFSGNVYECTLARAVLLEPPFADFPPLSDDVSVCPDSSRPVP